MCSTTTGTSTSITDFFFSLIKGSNSAPSCVFVDVCFHAASASGAVRAVRGYTALARCSIGWFECSCVCRRATCVLALFVKIILSSACFNCIFHTVASGRASGACALGAAAAHKFIFVCS